MNTEKTISVSLWNPYWTIIWSFLFTPVLGSFLQRTNWSEMGEIEETANSGLWIFLSLAFMLGYLFAEPWLPETDFSSYYFLIAYSAFYLLWVFLYAIKQVKFVSLHYGSNYHHRLWGKPIMLGAAGLLLWMAISLTYIIGLIASGIISADVVK